ncbi:MAG: hypothetical protein GEU79_06915 [Acidimicrobiia bacterium]|nr:hypothetical protein [Acidimicrobiia bacterium]
MARVRLFANLREIAGTPTLDIDGTTVGSVIEAVTDRFGDKFRRGMESARLWRNGEAVAPGDPIGPDDELAILPPVSGGADTMRPQEVQLDPTVFVGLLTLVVVALTHFFGGSPSFAAATVAAAGVWAADLNGVMENRGRGIAAAPVAIAAGLGAVASHAFGGVGYVIAFIVAVIASAAWAIGFFRYRELNLIAPGVVVAVVGATAVSSLILTRDNPGEDAITIFIVAVVVAVAAGTLAEQLGSIPFLDPYAVNALMAVVAAVITGLILDQDAVGYLVVGLGVAVALVAGRGLGAMLRLGHVSLSQQLPGWSPSLDGAVVAAAILYPLTQIAL